MFLSDGPEAFTQCWEGRISEGDKRMRNSLIKVGICFISNYTINDRILLQNILALMFLVVYIYRRF